MTSRSFSLAALALTCLFPLAAGATESGAPILPIGVMDLGSGQLPPPTDLGLVSLRYTHYRATRLFGNDGKQAPVKFDLTVDTVGVAFIKMTDIALGSATFGWGAVLPVIRGDVHIGVDTPVGPLALADGKDDRQGDAQIIPLILRWTPAPGLFTNATLTLQLPTGHYRKTGAFNSGANHASVVPSFAFTWLDASGWEVSNQLQVNIHARNKDTDYRSGTELQTEFAAGRHIGPWTVGLGGYHLQQLSDDKAPGLLNGNRVRVTALGPALNFFELGSGLPVVWAHLYKEFNVRNRSAGAQFAMRAAWTF